MTNDDINQPFDNYRQFKKSSVAFNSNCARSFMEMNFNPGPGQYYNKVGGAFKIDYVNKESERRIMSQEGGPRGPTAYAGKINNKTGGFTTAVNT